MIIYKIGAIFNSNFIDQKIEVLTCQLYEFLQLLRGRAIILNLQV